MSNVKIDIAAEFKGKKAFEDAEDKTSSLQKNTDKLAKALLAAFSVKKIIDFGKASFEAFAEDQKAAAKLANTVKNLGLEFANPQIADFIDNLTKATGVADDKLRPAFQALLTTTGSLTHSQELLKNAIDISAGSGIDLENVAQDLANAYVGNTKGLKKYNLGLTNAELKASKFEDIMVKLNKQFSGAQQVVLNTYAGKVDYLKNRAAEAQETIGKGLVDALGMLTGQTDDVTKLGDAFDSMALYLANVERGLGVVGSKLTAIGEIPFVGDILKFGQQYFSIAGLLNKLGEDANHVKSTGFSFFGSQFDDYTKKKNADALAKAEADAARRQKELADAQKKQTKALKEQALLKKQGSIFDMQQIQLVAALKGKLSDEERDRVLLQLAILQGNEEAAAKLSAKIADSIDKTGQLKAMINSVEATSNPFKQWQDALNGILQTMTEIQNKAGAKYDVGGHEIGSLVPIPITPITPYYGGGSGGGNVSDASGFAGVVVQIDGKTVATAMQDQSLSGNQTTVYRGGGGSFQFS